MLYFEEYAGCAEVSFVSVEETYARQGGVMLLLSRYLLYIGYSMVEV